MDGMDVAPVELPDTSVKTVQRDEPPSGDQPRTVALHPPNATDPAANLALPDSQRGKLNFVNHWNQYKALAEGGATERTLATQPDQLSH